MDRSKKGMKLLSIFIIFGTLILSQNLAQRFLNMIPVIPDYLNKLLFPIIQACMSIIYMWFAIVYTDDVNKLNKELNNHPECKDIIETLLCNALLFLYTIIISMIYGLISLVSKNKNEIETAANKAKELCKRAPSMLEPLKMRYKVLFICISIVILLLVFIIIFYITNTEYIISWITDIITFITSLVGGFALWVNIKNIL